MRVAVNSHALPVYKKNRIASLLCIFGTTTFLFSQSNFVMSTPKNRPIEAPLFSTKLTDKEIISRSMRALIYYLYYLPI